MLNKKENTSNENMVVESTKHMENRIREELRQELLHEGKTPEDIERIFSTFDI